MSSLIVREHVASVWATKLPDLPLKDAHNTNADYTAVLPSEWAALLFHDVSRRRIALGNPGCYRENGIITMRVYVKSGIGQTRALTLAEGVVSAWLNYAGLFGQLHFLEVSPPQDLADGGSVGDWYAVQVDVSYIYDTFS